jgi:hypothetical protein
MAGLSNALIDKVLNATLPTGTSGVPGTWAAYGGGAMKLLLTSTASSASASGTELTGTGYTAGGTAFGTASTASSGGSGVTFPAGSAISWTNGSGGNWTIQSGEVRDSAGVRTYFWNWTGAPVTVANGNTFQVAVGAVSANLS